MHRYSIHSYWLITMGGVNEKFLEGLAQILWGSAGILGKLMNKFWEFFRTFLNSEGGGLGLSPP